ncbi:hypothetical protein CEXT_713131, partial [Caerostris extrusa]
CQIETFLTERRSKPLLYSLTNVLYFCTVNVALMAEMRSKSFGIKSCTLAA